LAVGVREGEVETPGVMVGRQRRRRQSAAGEYGSTRKKKTRDRRTGAHLGC
jgi:hypothetical protein